MNTIGTPFQKITLALAFGIFLKQYIEINSFKLLITLIGLGLGMFFLESKKHSYSLRTRWNSIALLLIAVVIGMLNHEIQKPRYNINHYTNVVEVKTNELYTLKLYPVHHLKATKKHERYEVKVQEINGQSASGKLRLYIPVDSFNINLRPGELIVTTTQLRPVFSPKNPHQFNYKTYLEKQAILHTIEVHNDEFLRLKKIETFRHEYAYNLRESLITKLKINNIPSDELSMIKALLFGQRQEISDELYDNYKAAGVVHILAVSGLHVGILMLIFELLFNPLKFLSFGKPLKTFSVVVLLWCFAVLTGLSPSVTRAVLMFSLFSIARGLQRPSNSLNTLCLSAFILLLIDSKLLWNIGFQLSYAAVAAIIIIKPQLDKWIVFKNKLLNYFLELFKVSVAAQLGVFPLSIYYFHQFPSLFFLANLAVIPCLVLLLHLGTFIVILAVVLKTPTWLIYLFSYTASFMNSIIKWIASKEVFYFKSIPFDHIDVLFCYGLIVVILKFISNKSARTIMWIGLITIGYQSANLIRFGKKSTTKFLVFHKIQHSVLAFQTPSTLWTYHNVPQLENTLFYPNYILGENLKNQQFDSIRPLYLTYEKNIIVIDGKNPIYSSTVVKPNWVILINSPKINLDRVLNELKPELVIADGSNFKTYRERWTKSCSKQNITLHDTFEKGAFIYTFYGVNSGLNEL